MWRLDLLPACALLLLLPKQLQSGSSCVAR
jgi:hypothetical protein